jgi:RNA polymerase sigma-70 factor (ECF subfamily)
MPPSERVWRERGLRRAILAGDERAWRTLYDEAFADLYAYVRWRCGGLGDRADEVVQETWMTAVRRIAAFDPNQGAFAAWLRGIAVNLLRNYFRRPVRSRPLAEADGMARSDVTDRERAESVAVALAELPPRYEAVLRAKYLDGRSVQDIAGDHGETPKAVESLLSRAREAFREAYLRLETS